MTHGDTGTAPSSAHRTVLEQKIAERHQTIDEFAAYVVDFARDHEEVGTLSARHLQRLVSGRGSKGQPLGPVRPATARLLEGIFSLDVAELLAPPPIADPATNGAGIDLRSTSSVDLHSTKRHPDIADADRPDEAREHLGAAFGWLDHSAGWLPDTSRRKVTSRLAKISTGELIDQRVRRSRISRGRIVHALSEYYVDSHPEYGAFRARCGDRRVATSVLTRPGWLDLACPLTPDRDRLTLSSTSGPKGNVEGVTAQAVRRLVEAAAADVRIANVPLYRLLSVDVTADAIGGTVGQSPFIEYALTMDLLETEIVDAVGARATIRRGALPLRDRYLPDLGSVLDIGQRLCFGGALALCAVARPADPYRGGADYALLVQERSANVLNAVGRLSVIPKSFHQPMKDARADTPIGATLRREMEEELFGRAEVDSTNRLHRSAAPMHLSRLSAPMRWLLSDPTRLRMEFTGFGLNLLSGNYEFANLIVVEDEEFWIRYGGQIEANWETSGLRVYSSLDHDAVEDLISEDSWSDEGLFAFLLGLRRLTAVGGKRIRLPAVT